ncbi:MAG: hypothetical protein A3C50_01360 [Candidatus Staskawiczbacteria bacterium RIFCSPHIGHO2_02_FULL_43_16]|uniref:PABS domain-containing protein n=1 Tax=Candidatus Staskawiczbacteria bacterium RIFCSPHIGHO2_01_FULL_41_41 TaxID=1802203 RepID=A0A1G2HUU9_9BACT|nr:MAG: hypothetical protein A2822_04555 [Candidatus Staskawiczbacteria bacterium RIFCSPHIGHO2_01_FULL_41_41]OGZ68855.1 MAG: hypothetical protein A3C50_01360 [Candidatus Staskawiczbacteria bacterium RIFCSPHIGHO2_02_FULL_43_16]OGZ74228.1 MAG: hypothetical protein A3A12_00350 [Candidatus Staskawiczbacteria bacterium RIFCSPLOWO2_01_FULL_43_17b]
MKNLKDLFLLASVFVTGSAVLVIEIIAIRMLSPHYGNTMYATSSVIGVILAALSVGYYAGGIIADKHPRRGVFYAIIFVSGITVMVMQAASKVILPFFGTLFSITQGPLISSLFLFFVPAFLLATLSPIAIKLYSATDENLGQRAGKIFFWSTLGSINGSLLTGFFLIPFFGIDTIVMATGAVLSLWACLGFAWHSTGHKKIILLLAGAGMICLSLYYFSAAGVPKPAGIVYQKDGLYEKIIIQDGMWGGRSTRFLFQDRSYSAAMYLDSLGHSPSGRSQTGEASDLVFDYTKYYSLYQLINPGATTAFAIGGGGYSIPKALLQDSPAMRVDVAEIEPSLHEIAKTYFNLPATDRLQHYAQDGRRFLKTTNKKYGIIIGDAYYSLFSIPIHLATQEFFALAKSKLEDNGVFIGNFVGYLDAKNPSFIASEIKTFKSVFENSYFFAVQAPDAPSSQNIIFLGINGNKTIDFQSPAVAKNTNPILKNLGLHQIDMAQIDFSKHREITDNYAPVEYLVSKIINRWQ